jgi:hypothetical protein
MMDWLKGYNIPVSAAVGIGAVLASGYFFLERNYVSAATFGNYQSNIERRILTEKAQQLDAEILKIEVKCRAYPQKCDAVDKALLDRYRQDLRRVKRDLDPPPGEKR